MISILGFFNRGIQIRHSVGLNKLNIQRRFWREMERKVRVLMLPPINLSNFCFDYPSCCTLRNTKKFLTSKDQDHCAIATTF